jgi:MFS superfamily sulfate permease-like transporter
VCDRILGAARAETPLPKLVVLDLSASPHVDMHSAQRLGELADELTAMGIRVQAVEARSSVRDRLRDEGVDEKLGGVNRFMTVAEAVDKLARSSAPVPAASG